MLAHDLKRREAKEKPWGAGVHDRHEAHGDGRLVGEGRPDGRRRGDGRRGRHGRGRQQVCEEWFIPRRHLRFRRVRCRHRLAHEAGSHVPDRRSAVLLRRLSPLRGRVRGGRDGHERTVPHDGARGAGQTNAHPRLGSGGGRGAGVLYLGRWIPRLNVRVARAVGERRKRGVRVRSRVGAHGCATAAAAHL